MKSLTKTFIVSLPLMIASQSAQADWSTTVTATSDYTFNGVSQTQNSPAIQASLDKALDNGIYAGTWASNVDFGGATNTEWDFYLGQYLQLSDNISFDYGIAYYTYHGASESSEGNYPEVYANFGFANAFGNTELNFWYSWDYFGTGAGHIVSMVAHTVEIAPNHALRASFDVSNSLDGDQWSWNGNDSSYHHYRLAYQTSYAGFNLELAAENTNLDWDTADERVVVSVSRTFDL
ncbi:TorF family putative porin [Thalassotalea ponticola]|uniref:TorF family putative porin n=1 Tax=Thalassotalea ponticola TaxID=1523392 RepID=UPI0025B4605C|nr:TorF family putative porin [Thalassotalea ponticola]MDN3651613.1 TorF family putative porin [Thalassotalea ponticola]